VLLAEWLERLPMGLKASCSIIACVRDFLIPPSSNWVPDSPQSWGSCSGGGCRWLMGCLTSIISSQKPYSVIDHCWLVGCFFWRPRLNKIRIFRESNKIFCENQVGGMIALQSMEFAPTINTQWHTGLSLCHYKHPMTYGIISVSLKHHSILQGTCRVPAYPWHWSRYLQSTRIPLTLVTVPAEYPHTPDTGHDPKEKKTFEWMPCFGNSNQCPKSRGITSNRPKLYSSTMVETSKTATAVYLQDIKPLSQRG